MRTEIPVLKEMDALDWHERLHRAGFVRVPRAKEIWENGDQGNDYEDHATDQCQPMFFETPPHQFPIGGDIKRIVLTKYIVILCNGCGSRCG